jgi:divalent metal cation (Fe/Co/Zn/Cd) transporter
VVQAISDARDPVILTVLFEDSAALLGLIAALAGLGLAWATGNMIFDGLASLLVGFMLAAVAFILARETKDLLLGESVVSADAERIRAIVTSFPLVQKLVAQRTMHLGPDEVLLVLKLEFVDTLNTAAIEAAIDEIERRLRQELPLLKRIWIEPGTGSSAAASRGTLDR